MKTYFLFRGHNRFGQSVLEYSAIAMLVIVGILAMGPYVVRSVNAYFKSAEEQAHDSFREDIRQTNLHGAEVNYDLGECDCSFSGTPVCGNGIMCPVTQFMYPYNCSPAGCLSDGDKLAYGFVKCEMEPNPLKSWTECFNTEGRFPYSEAEYQQWVADGCGFRCCTEAEQAEEQCYFFDDPDSSMSFGNTVVKYRGSPHDAANGWQLDVGDRILNSSDGKIYTVVGALPLPAGTAAYWDLNDNMLDIIGGNDGAIGGGANFVEGQVGGALEFDGATSYVEVPHSAALALTDFTLEAWVKSYGVAPNSAGAILTKGEGVVSGNLNYMMLLYNFYGSPYFSPLNTSNATYLACQFEDVTDANYYGIGLTPVSLNVFFHAACSFNTATGDMKVYINGVEQSVMLSRQGTTIASLAGLVPSTEPSDFYVGGGFSSSADTSGDDGVKNIFNGVIDEAGVYNRPLSSAEIYERYTVGLAGKVAGEWDGNEVVWDSGIGPLENTIIYVTNDAVAWIYEDGVWSVYTTGSGAGEGYVRMQRMCGMNVDIEQQFFEQNFDCLNRCGQKDAVAEWCGSYNYQVPASLSGTVTYVNFGGCSADPDDNKCTAFCPEGLPADALLGCVCPDGLVTFEGECCPRPMFVRPAIASDCSSSSCTRREATYDLVSDMGYLFAPLHQSEITQILMDDQWSGKQVEIYPKDLTTSFWAFKGSPGAWNAYELPGDLDNVTGPGYDKCVQGGAMQAALAAAGTGVNNHTEAYTGKPLFNGGGYLTGFKFVACSPDTDGDKGVSTAPYVTITIRYNDCSTFLP